MIIKSYKQLMMTWFVLFFLKKVEPYQHLSQNKAISSPQLTHTGSFHPQKKKKAGTSYLGAKS